MSEYLQVVSDNGYIIHAVPAGTSRHGRWKNYVGARTLCKKLRGRDAQASPNLRLQFADWANDKETAKPFSRNPDDFDLQTWSARKICPDCCRVVLAKEA